MQARASFADGAHHLLMEQAVLSEAQRGRGAAKDTHRMIDVHCSIHECPQPNINVLIAGLQDDCNELALADFFICGTRLRCATTSTRAGWRRQR